MAQQTFSDVQNDFCIAHNPAQYFNLWTPVRKWKRMLTRAHDHRCVDLGSLYPTPFDEPGCETTGCASGNCNNRFCWALRSLRGTYRRLDDIFGEADDRNQSTVSLDDRRLGGTCALSPGGDTSDMQCRFSKPVSTNSARTEEWYTSSLSTLPGGHTTTSLENSMYRDIVQGASGSTITLPAGTLRRLTITPSDYETDTSDSSKLKITFKGKDDTGAFFRRASAAASSGILANKLMAIAGGSISCYTPKKVNNNLVMECPLTNVASASQKLTHSTVAGVTARMDLGFDIFTFVQNSDVDMGNLVYGVQAVPLDPGEDICNVLSGHGKTLKQLLESTSAHTILGGTWNNVNTDGATVCGSR